MRIRDRLTSFARDESGSVMIGVGVWPGSGSGAGTSIAAALSGLTSGVAEIGDHASIIATMSDGSTITAYAWGSAPGGSQYGTGANPADFAAGNGGVLYLTATAGGIDYTTVASIRYAVPTAAGALADQSFSDDTGNQTFDASGDFTFGGTLVYSLTTAPAGVTINSGTGVITFDTDALAIQAGTSIVVRATDAVDTGRFAQSGFSLTIASASTDIIEGGSSSSIPTDIIDGGSASSIPTDIIEGQS